MLAFLSFFSSCGWLDIIATGLVAVGVAGELWSFLIKIPFNPTAFPALESKKKQIEKWSLVILCVGVFLEVIAVPKNLSEVANLNQQSVWLTQSNLLLAANVEGLRSNNIVLAAELKRPARRITPENKAKFIELLKNCTGKNPVRIFVGSEDKETTTYVAQVRKMLDDAGYGTGKEEGITHVGGDFINEIDDTDIDSDMNLDFYGEPMQDIHLNGCGFIENLKTKSYVLWTASSNICSIPVPAAIDRALQAIDINVTVRAGKYFLKPGEWGIFIPEKF
jgi:hypothetical protein